MEDLMNFMMVIISEYYQTMLYNIDLYNILSELYLKKSVRKNDELIILWLKLAAHFSFSINMFFLTSLSPF